MKGIAKKYKVVRSMQFCGFKVPKGTVLETPSRIPSWTKIFLIDCIPLKIPDENGTIKIRLVSATEVKPV